MEKTRTKRYVLLAILLSLALCVGGGLFLTNRAQAAGEPEDDDPIKQIAAENIVVLYEGGHHSIKFTGDFSTQVWVTNGTITKGDQYTNGYYTQLDETILINGVSLGSASPAMNSVKTIVSQTEFTYWFPDWTPATDTVITVKSGCPLYKHLYAYGKMAVAGANVRYIWNGTSWTKGNVAATSIAFAATQHQISVGEELNLGATFAPVGTLGGTITYSSSDTAKATVDAAGKVTAVAEGNATITATDGTLTNTYDIEVMSSYTVTGLEFTANGTQSIYTGATSYVLPSVSEIRTFDGGATSKVPVTITADNVATKADAAAFDNTKAGTYTFTVTHPEVSSVTADFTVEVKAIPQPTVDLSAGNEWGSRATVHFPMPNTSNMNGVWYTFDNTMRDSKVLYNGGNLPGNPAATFTVGANDYAIVIYGLASNYIAGDVITIKAGFPLYQDKQDYTVFFAVTQKDYRFVYLNGTWQAVGDPESITFAATSHQISVGEELNLGASYLPMGSEGETITYTTDKEGIVTVDANGKVTGVAAGEVVITASGNGFTNTYTLAVMSSYVVTGLEITANGTQSIYTGASYVLPSVSEVRDYDGAENKVPVTITADNVATKTDTPAFDNTTPGTYTFTVTVENESADFTVEVTAVPTPTMDSKPAHWSAGNATIHFNIPNNSKVHDKSGTASNGGGGYAVKNARAKILYNGVTFTELMGLEANESLYNIVLFGTPAEGDIVTLQSGLTLYNASTATDSEAAQSLFAVTQQEYKFVFRNGAWIAAVDATDIAFTATAGVVLKTDAAFNLGAKFVPENGIGAAFTYESSNTSVATVDANGLVTPVDVGTTTITVTAGTLTKTYTLQVVAEAQKTALSVVSYGTQTIDPYTTYQLPTAKWTLKVGEQTTDGAPFTVDAANVSEGNFDNSKPGTYTLTVTIEEKSFNFTVTVKEFTEIEWPDAIPAGALRNSDIYFATENSFGSANGSADGYCPDLTKVQIYRNGEVLTHASHVRIGANTIQWYFLGSGSEFAAYDPKAGALEGDRLVLEKGFRFTIPNTGVTWATAGFTYVYHNGAWGKYVGEPTKIEIAKPQGVTNTIYTNIPVQLSPVFTADGTSGSVIWTSSNDTIATVSNTGRVIALATGTVEITVACTTQETTPKTLTAKVTFTVKDSGAVTGVSIVNGYSIHVVKGETISALPSKWYARPVYTPDNDGVEVEGNEFELTLGENLILPATQPTDKVGQALWDVTVKVPHGGTTVDKVGKLDVTVYEYYDQEISNVGVLDPEIWGGWGFHMLVAFGNTSSNNANITSYDFSAIKEKITYTHADGTPVEFAVFGMLGGHLGLRPGFYNDPDISMGTLGNYYKEGDILIFHKGMYTIKQVGEQIIIDGYLQEDATYIYHGAIWAFYKDYTGITATKESVTVAIGKSMTAGVNKVPVNATEGLITYVSADTEIATVSASGLIRGVKEGSTTITATITDLNDETRAPISVTVEVTVVDEITGIVFEPETLTLKSGADLDLAGVKAYYVWASGKKGEQVDLSNASISGYDPEKTEQSITVKVGEVSGKLKVVVGNTDKKGCGCGSSAVATAGGAAAVLLLGAAVVLFTRKKKEA